MVSKSELLVGQRYDIEIDIWAVGCIMEELLHGQPMFFSPLEEAALERIFPSYTAAFCVSHKY